MSGLFSKKTAIDPEQKALIIHAQKRIAQRKSLYKHIVFYLSVVLVAFLLNIIAGVGSAYQFLHKNWFFWLAVGWGIFVVYHILKFFFIS
ncbi:MAG: 2TM domain-containing protein, partial [Flavobacteriaceae bacterium]|nr:2TM domain-containing protein [Flavobacteriaceae bacterium]